MGKKPPSKTPPVAPAPKAVSEGARRMIEAAKQAVERRKRQRDGWIDWPD